MNFIEHRSAVIAVDVQNDFCPGGKLAVAQGNLVVEPLNKLFQAADQTGMLTIVTRDWHPKQAVHFAGFGGVWPEHCIMESEGAKFYPDLKIDPATFIVSKGVDGKDAYSGFDGSITSSADRADLGTPLNDVLRARGIKRLFVGGLATDYCVKQTAIDGARFGYQVFLIEEAVRAVDINPGDGNRALEEMKNSGVKVISLERALELIAQS